MSVLVPAIAFKNEIERQFNLKLYSRELMFYDGCIESYFHEIKIEENKFAYAIVDSELIGYISFRVDWYSSCAYNFTLIRFKDMYFDNPSQEYKSTLPIMTAGIREAIREIESFNLHRIDFRCISENPALQRYRKLVTRFGKTYDVNEIIFHDNFKDTQGEFHDTHCFELIRH